MTAPLILATERVDDMPRFLAQLERMGRQPLWDQYVPTPGTWVGLSLGWVSVLGLTHMRSEGDHRLNHVAPWATQRLHTRRPCTGPVVHPWDGGDDRLAPVLEAVSDERRWSALAGALTQHVRRVYDLEPACVRRESTTANGQWTVTADGWCPGGPRHDPRPARPQVKGMVSALDPRGLPVATDVGPGQRAAAPVDVPAITRVWEGLGRRGRL